MGLKMEEMHNPTIPLSLDSRSSNYTNGTMELMGLIEDKDKIEGELSALFGVLESHGVNMHTSLTTFDGYPRDDIDVAQIRITRARIIRRRNDYKDLMSRIETGLHALHAAQQGSSSSRTEDRRVQSETASERRLPSHPNSAPGNSLELPFAKVNSIVAGSPADDAGLKAGDEILKFGDINFMNHDKLRMLAETVRMNEGRSISLKIARKDSIDGTSEPQVLQLTPRSNWGGRGLIGCHILPC